MGNDEHVNFKVHTGNGWEIDPQKLVLFLMVEIASIWELSCHQEMSSWDSRLFAEDSVAGEDLVTSRLTPGHVGYFCPF